MLRKLFLLALCLWSCLLSAGPSTRPFLPPPHGFGGVVQAESVPLPLLKQLRIGWVVMVWYPSMSDTAARAMVDHYAPLGQTNVLVCTSLEQCFKARTWGVIEEPFNEPDEVHQANIPGSEYGGIVKQLVKEGLPIGAPGASTPRATTWLGAYAATGAQAPYKVMHGYFVPLVSLDRSVLYTEIGPYGADFVPWALSVYRSGLTAAVFQVVNDGTTPCFLTKAPTCALNANGIAFARAVSATIR